MEGGLQEGRREFRFAGRSKGERGMGKTNPIHRKSAPLPPLFFPFSVRKKLCGAPLVRHLPKKTYMLAAADKKVVISLICLESVNVILVVYYYLHCSSGPNPRMTAARREKM